MEKFVGGGEYERRYDVFCFARVEKKGGGGRYVNMKKELAR